MREKVNAKARELGLDVDVKTLDRPTRTVQEAAAAVGCGDGRDRQVARLRLRRRAGPGRRVRRAPRRHGQGRRHPRLRGDPPGHRPRRSAWRPASRSAASRRSATTCRSSSTRRCSPTSASGPPAATATRCSASSRRSSPSCIAAHVADVAATLGSGRASAKRIATSVPPSRARAELERLRHLSHQRQPDAQARAVGPRAHAGAVVADDDADVRRRRERGDRHRPGLAAVDEAWTTAFDTASDTASSIEEIACSSRPVRPARTRRRRGATCATEPGTARTASRSCLTRWSASPRSFARTCTALPSRTCHTQSTRRRTSWPSTWPSTCPKTTTPPADGADVLGIQRQAVPEALGIGEVLTHTLLPGIRVRTAGELGGARKVEFAIVADPLERRLDVAARECVVDRAHGRDLLLDPSRGAVEPWFRLRHPRKDATRTGGCVVPPGARPGILAAP